MARKTPRRDSKGRFVKASAGSKRKRARSNPARKKTPRRDASGRFMRSGGSAARKKSPSRSAARRNPPGFLEQLPGAGMDALSITAGKAASRAIPDALAGTVPAIPRAGIGGQAVNLATAVALAFITEQFVGAPELGRAMLVGGMQGVAEAVLVQYNVPFIAPALRNDGMGLYASGPVLSLPGAPTPGASRNLGLYGPGDYARVSSGVSANVRI